MITPRIDSLTAIVGVDWGDSQHDVCIQASIGEGREFDVIAHHPAVVDQWIKSLHDRLGDR